MDWCCLLAQNAPLQAVLLLNASPCASSSTSSSKGSTSLGSIIHPEQTRCCSLEACVDGHRLMHAGAESALQTRSCSRPIAS